ncbi:D-alanine-D-alanine ligase [Alkalithermobacter thermoalcaliphilus JW-YL-7 = DSM 7308]|uniref:D-alanine--D-alanine ligase n=1 Tax=Alkalithermobacter thermoalcaliphilus JW-YL-7 = DSM 7308 TaxID=1121328 RepID=A0A150FMS7_CLOPD|nr:D-alanine--D-alanine ligase [[Clostridium] paradoxum JW-YL-7 = DSM 7308]SHL22075.1 D-alanine-D-alanine ligase [[Clostridium] paradoxum JW-YL-7 = DSM 7308]
MKKNVALIFGGKSGEHEVSLSSACSIYNNIDKQKYNIYTIGITKQGDWMYYEGDSENIKNGNWVNLSNKNAKINLIPTKDKKIGIEVEDKFYEIDVFFPVIHGPYGEDGTIQGLFEISNIPYVGCSVLSSSIGMDKIMCKKIFKEGNLPQVEFAYTTEFEFKKDKEKVISDIEKSIKYPMFVKPANLGSSVGISKVKTKDELEKAISEALKYDRRVIIEQGINAREIEVSVLGNDEVYASVAGEIIPAKEFYDYEAKYISESSKLLIPASIDENLMEKVRDMAIKAFKMIDGCGLARVDFFIDKDTNEIYINEINTMPGFTKISMYPKLWEASGIKYKDLIDKLIDLAIERFNQKNSKEVCK